MGRCVEDTVYLLQITPTTMIRQPAIDFDDSLRIGFAAVLGIERAQDFPNRANRPYRERRAARYLPACHSRYVSDCPSSSARFANRLPFVASPVRKAQ